MLVYRLIKCKNVIDYRVIGKKVLLRLKPLQVYNHKVILLQLIEKYILMGHFRVNYMRPINGVQAKRLIHGVFNHAVQSVLLSNLSY